MEEPLQLAIIDAQELVQSRVPKARLGGSIVQSNPRPPVAKVLHFGSRSKSTDHETETADIHLI